MKKILFSIIIPVYNTEKYLSQCLKSVLNQRFNQEKFEVIIVNDGSTDNSLNVINKYLSRFKNSVLIDRENRGLLFSRIEAVEKSRGEYILFLDSDDYLPEDCLIKYSKEIKNSNYDIIKGNYYIVDKNNTEIKSLRYKESMEISELKKMFEGILKSDNYNSVWGQIIKREKIIDCTVDTSIAMGEDLEINQNIYLNAKSIKLINDYVYCYRRNPTSMTHTISINRLQNNIIDIEKVYSKLIENVKTLKDKKLIKLSYIKYLNKKNEFDYLLIKNCDNIKLIYEIINKSLNSKYIIEAKDNLKYKDILPRKKRIFIYMMLCNYKKMYIYSLKLISKIKR